MAPIGRELEHLAKLDSQRLGNRLRGELENPLQRRGARRLEADPGNRLLLPRTRPDQLIRQFALGDVLAGADGAHRSARGVVENLPAFLDMFDPAFREQQPVLDRERPGATD
jgi:hypothetical protein